MLSDEYSESITLRQKFSVGKCQKEDHSDTLASLANLIYYCKVTSYCPTRTVHVRLTL